MKRIFILALILATAPVLAQTSYDPSVIPAKPAKAKAAKKAKAQTTTTATKVEAAPLAGDVFQQQLAAAVGAHKRFGFDLKQWSYDLRQWSYDLR